MTEILNIVTIGLLSISVLTYKKTKENTILKEKLKNNNKNIKKITSQSIKIVQLEKEINDIDLSLMKANLQLKSLDSVHVELLDYKNKSKIQLKELSSIKEENLKFKNIMDEQNKQFEDFKDNCMDRLKEIKKSNSK